MSYGSGQPYLWAIPMSSAYEQCDTYVQYLWAIPMCNAYVQCLCAIPVSNACEQCLCAMPMCNTYVQYLCAMPMCNTYVQCLWAIPMCNVYEQCLCAMSMFYVQFLSANFLWAVQYLCAKYLCAKYLWAVLMVRGRSYTASPKASKEAPSSPLWALLWSGTRPCTHKRHKTCNTICSCVTKAHRTHTIKEHSLSCIALIWDAAHTRTTGHATRYVSVSPKLTAHTQ